MQSENKLFDDLSKLSSSALGVLAGAREEVEQAFKAQFDRWLASLDLVRRDEFDAVKAMAEKARAENEALSQRLAKLEAAAKSPTRKKPSKAQ